MYSRAFSPVSITKGKRGKKRQKKLSLSSHLSTRRSSIQRETLKREEEKGLSLSLSLSRNNNNNNNNNNNTNAKKKRFGIFFLRPTHQFSIRGGWCVRVESIGGLLKEPRERKSIIIFGWRALTCGGVEDQKPKKTNAGRVKAICASKRIF